MLDRTICVRVSSEVIDDAHRYGIVIADAARKGIVERTLEAKKELLNDC